ncbi:hypothetical protein SALBM135S_00144 [Streptomyces alboniger]
MTPVEAPEAVNGRIRELVGTYVQQKSVQQQSVQEQSVQQSVQVKEGA